MKDWDISCITSYSADAGVVLNLLNGTKSVSTTFVYDCAKSRAFHYQPMPNDPKFMMKASQSDKLFHKKFWYYEENKKKKIFITSANMSAEESSLCYNCGISIDANWKKKHWEKSEIYIVENKKTRRKATTLWDYLKDNIESYTQLDALTPLPPSSTLIENIKEKNSNIAINIFTNTGNSCNGKNVTINWPKKNERFHTKSYLFTDEKSNDALLYLGSANMTLAGWGVSEKDSNIEGGVVFIGNKNELRGQFEKIKAIKFWKIANNIETNTEELDGSNDDTYTKIEHDKFIRAFLEKNKLGNETKIIKFNPPRAYKVNNLKYNNTKLKKTKIDYSKWYLDYPNCKLSGFYSNGNSKSFFEYNIPWEYLAPKEHSEIALDKIFLDDIFLESFGNQTNSTRKKRKKTKESEFTTNTDVRINWKTVVKYIKKKTLTKKQIKFSQSIIEDKLKRIAKIEDNDFKHSDVELSYKLLTKYHVLEHLKNTKNA